MTADRMHACSHRPVLCVCGAEWGSTKTGEQKDLIVTALNCVLKVPQYLPQERRFDIRVLVSRRSHTTLSCHLVALGSNEAFCHVCIMQPIEIYAILTFVRQSEQAQRVM